jgi:hypothetical protein
MTNKLVNSEYTFTNVYVDKHGRKCKAIVILKVNFDTKSYIVLPHGSPRNEFGFVSDSKNNHEMWKAVLHLIEEAVDYGESLVNPAESIDDVIANIDVNSDLVE